MGMKKEVKRYLKGKKGKGGRNNEGRITVWHRGGGNKRRLRKVEKSYRSDLMQRVVGVEYDPGRSGGVVVLKEEGGSDDGVYLAQGTKGVKLGGYVKRYLNGVKEAWVRDGDEVCLGELRVGSVIYNIEDKRKIGGIIGKAGGAYCQYIERDKKRGRGRVRMGSGEKRWMGLDVMVRLGVSSIREKERNKRKAGRSRWLGRRPIVRGVAMNPVDHPHGGGEGKTSGGRPSVTPWGRITK